MQWNLTLDEGEDDWSYSVDETLDGGYIITGSAYLSDKSIISLCKLNSQGEL